MKTSHKSDELKKRRVHKSGTYERHIQSLFTASPPRGYQGVRSLVCLESE